MSLANPTPTEQIVLTRALRIYLGFDVEGARHAAATSLLRELGAGLGCADGSCARRIIAPDMKALETRAVEYARGVVSDAGADTYQDLEGWQ